MRKNTPIKYIVVVIYNIVKVQLKLFIIVMIAPHDLFVNYKI